MEPACSPAAQGSYGNGKPGKVMEFENGYLQSWGEKNQKNHGHLLYSYVHFIIMNMLFKE